MEMWAVSIFYLFMNIAAINILVVFFYFEMWIKSGKMNDRHFGQMQLKFRCSVR